MSTIKADNISPVGSTLNLTAPVAGLSVASGLTVGGIAFFSGGVTFNSTTDHAGVARFASTSTFTGLVTLTGGATSAAVISCGTAPTQGQHLANKTYVDDMQRIGATRHITLITNASQAITSTVGYNTTAAFTITSVGGSLNVLIPAGYGTWHCRVEVFNTSTGALNAGTTATINSGTNTSIATLSSWGQTIMLSFTRHS